MKVSLNNLIGAILLSMALGFALGFAAKRDRIPDVSSKTPFQVVLDGNICTVVTIGAEDIVDLGKIPRFTWVPGQQPNEARLIKTNPQQGVWVSQITVFFEVKE